MPEEKKPSTKAPSQAKRILVVDDDRDACEILKAKLGALGFEVGFAHDGSEAFVKATKQKQDAIILDIRMPAGEDGLTFLRKLRAFRDDENETVRKTPVVIYSAAGEQMRSLFELEGISDFIPKTVSLDEIRDRILKIVTL